MGGLRNKENVNWDKKNLKILKASRGLVGKSTNGKFRIFSFVKIFFSTVFTEHFYDVQLYKLLIDETLLCIVPTTEYSPHFFLNYSYDTIKVIRSGRWLIGCLNDYLFVYDIYIVNIVADAILVDCFRCRTRDTDSEALVMVENAVHRSSTGMKSLLFH